MKLLIEAIVKFLFGVLIVGVLLFIPAGSFSYFNAWLFMFLLFVPMFIVGIILCFFNPRLLKSRLDAREVEGDQNLVLLFSGIMFILGFVVVGFNYRFGFVILPNYLVILFSILFLIFYFLYGVVLFQNTYLSRVIRVSTDQHVIDTGFYSIVRHPMYLVTILLFLCIPFILNSLISFFIFLFYPFIIVKRIKNEEFILERDLKGYSEYKKRVKYRLIPFLW